MYIYFVHGMEGEFVVEFARNFLILPWSHFKYTEKGVSFVLLFPEDKTLIPSLYTYRKVYANLL